MILFEIQKQIESLQELISDGIIDSSEGNKTILMLKEKKVKKIHNRAINQRSDGRFVTKVECGDKLKQITACTYEKLINKLFDYYFGKANLSLESLYPQWIAYREKESSVKAKTIKENGYLWNAHLKGESITQRPIRNLTPTDFIKFFRVLTKGRSMTRKRFNDVKSIINGLYYYAIEIDIVSHNPLLEINYNQFPYKPEKSKHLPFTEEERLKLLHHVPESDLYALAIKLDFYLTLRIGELKGLRFDDIQGDFICVQRFVNEKNEIENDIKGHTSYGIRWLPLTDSCKIIIEQIRALNPDSEYLFFRNGKPLCTSTFNRRLKKYCEEINILYRPSHQIRFANASLLYKNGVSQPELQGMLGHSTLNMTNHYLKNIVSLDDTREKVIRAIG